MTRRSLIAAVGVILVGSAPAGEPVTATVSDGTIEFCVGGELFTRYHTGKDVAKPYFYPVVAPNGVSVTRGWPMSRGCRTKRPITSTRNPSGSVTGTSFRKACN